MRSFMLALFTATGLLGGPLMAAELTEEKTVTWYDVEIIVFRNLETRSSETWPPDAGYPDVADARPLFPPETEDGDANDPQVATTPVRDDAEMRYPDAPTPYVPLDASERQMDGIMGSLRRSSRYEPLLHVAWSQPPLDRAQSPYLRITLPETLPSDLPDDESDKTGSSDDAPLLGRVTDEDDRKSFDDPLPEEEDTGPRLARPLDGVVQMSVSRYLHFDLDLVYLPDDLNTAVLGDVPPATREWTEQDRRAREERRRDILDALARGDITLEEAEILAIEPERQVFEGFRLDQYRRMRSREIHYFDHPVYGAIVTITPREVNARTLELEPNAGGR